MSNNNKLNEPKDLEKSELLSELNKLKNLELAKQLSEQANLRYKARKSVEEEIEEESKWWDYRFTLLIKYVFTFVVIILMISFVVLFVYVVNEYIKNLLLSPTQPQLLSDKSIDKIERFLIFLAGSAVGKFGIDFLKSKLVTETKKQKETTP